MLEKVSFSEEKLSKERYKPVYDSLVSELVVLQQQARSKGVGLVVLLEGWDGAGKGSRLSDLLFNLDARATGVCVTKDIDLAEARMFQKLGQGVRGFHPVMQQFWEKLEPRGNITFFDCGWYTASIQRLLFEEYGKGYAEGKGPLLKKRDREKHLELIDLCITGTESFERQLVDDGYVVVKVFLHISKKVQKERLKKLHDDPSTRWRVSEAELKSTRNYKYLGELYDELLERSDYDFAPWVVVNGEDKRQANIDIAITLIESIRSALDKTPDAAAAAAEEKAKANSAGGLDGEASASAVAGDAAAQARAASALAPEHPRIRTLSKPIELRPAEGAEPLEREAYRKKLKKEQKKLYRLEQEMYLKRIPLMIMYEGWDAAGKGGNIKRVAQALDARAYSIFTSASPTKPELLHPHLWRYWTRLPKAGHVGIYDRSWYGRVLVERVEGFASAEQWSRAYDEINEFERELQKWGAVLIKFWVDVTQEEQLNRFRQREDDPAKQWKITDEDWRNRERYPQYKAAVDDMFRLTSTTYAPWHVLDSTDKRFARVKALETINAALQERLQEK